MQFNNIESFDHFQDETIFWAALSDPPAKLKTAASRIDGDNYNESCFGVCVIFDAKSQKFDFVVEMEGNNAHPVYYIDNDGDKTWFACEIPEELSRCIFSECQQILDLKAMEYGYKIKESVQFEDGSGFVVAAKSNSAQPFLTARFTTADRGQRYYDKKSYFHHWNNAIQDFTKRTEYQKHFVRIKSGQPQAEEYQKERTTQMPNKTKRPKRKRR